MNGRIFRLALDKGYGHLRDDNGDSRFFSVRDVVPIAAFDRMFEGQVVSFTAIDGTPTLKNNGLRAADVRVGSV